MSEYVFYVRTRSGDYERYKYYDYCIEVSGDLSFVDHSGLKWHTIKSSEWENIQRYYSDEN